MLSDHVVGEEQPILFSTKVVRKPTAKEYAALNEVLAAEKDPKPVLEDTFWAVLNSREFLFNH